MSETGTPHHTGDAALEVLRGYGVDTMFTLNGGHVWPLYDAAVKQDVRIVDVRHEQTATFAAEAWAKLTRKPGLAVLTAGPGVTNGVSAITTAHFNGTPLVVLGGRAPQGRWGSGSLQELDHVPIVASITKSARTVTSPDDSAKEIQHAVTTALTPHRGPVFVDFPIDVIFGSATAPDANGTVPRGVDPDPADVERAAALIAGAARPAIIVGSDVYWEGAWPALARFVETMRVPCWFNGLGRGCLPADHELAFTRTRGLLKTDADLVVVIGTALDFRLGFGRFGDAQVVHICDSPESRAAHVATAASPAGDLTAILDAMTAWSGADRIDHEPWIARVRDAETAAAASERELLEAGGDLIKPTRVYGELRQAPGARRGRDLRRRRLRVVRGQVRRGVHAGLLARHRSLRVPGERTGLRHGGPGRASRRADRRDARRRRSRVLTHGRRHARPPQPAGRDGGRQQRVLGSREVPDASDLRLRRRLRSAGRSAATTRS